MQAAPMLWALWPQLLGRRVGVESRIPLPLALPQPCKPPLDRAENSRVAQRRFWTTATCKSSQRKFCARERRNDVEPCGCGSMRNFVAPLRSPFPTHGWQVNHCEAMKKAWRPSRFMDFAHRSKAMVPGCAKQVGVPLAWSNYAGSLLCRG